VQQSRDGEAEGLERAGDTHQQGGRGGHRKRRQPEALKVLSEAQENSKRAQEENLALAGRWQEEAREGQAHVEQKLENLEHTMTEVRDCLVGVTHGLQDLNGNITKLVDVLMHQQAHSE
jgi:hypothetical protein